MSVFIFILFIFSFYITKQFNQFDNCKTAISKSLKHVELDF